MSKLLKNPPKSDEMNKRIERLNAATLNALREAGRKRTEADKQKGHK